MGLLDSLFNQSSQGGGLLDFLRNNAMNQQFGSGLPSDQAQYGTPMGAMAQIQPMAQPSVQPQPAMPQAPAMQPAQPMPQQQPQESPGGFGAGLSGFVNNLQAGPIGAIIGGIGSAAGLQSPALKQQNQTAKFLESKGFDPALAKTIVSDPALLRSVIPQIMGIGGQTDDIKEYQFAKRENPSLTFEKFMQQKKAVSGEYSLTPQFGTDEKGNTVMIQTGKGGTAIQTVLPPGVKLSSGVDKIDLGTTWGIIDKKTGQMVGQQAKDLRGAEREKELGTSQGQAAAKLPAALIDAASTSKKIDELLNTKDGLDSIVGAFDQFRPSWTLGDKGRDALARLEQLQGGAFLQAFNTLKGGGAITEAEGRKAEQAIARMQRSQSEADFRVALQDFRDAVNDGIKKLQASAGPEGKYPDAVKNMQSSGGSDLKKKYGLD